MEFRIGNIHISLFAYIKHCVKSRRCSYISLHIELTAGYTNCRRIIIGINTACTMLTIHGDHAAAHIEYSICRIDIHTIDTSALSGHIINSRDRTALHVYKCIIAKHNAGNQFTFNIDMRILFDV